MGIRGIGNTKAKAFSQVALALTAVITNPENENAAKNIEVARLIIKDIIDGQCQDNNKCLCTG
jgi:hypothetical protein